MNAGVLQRIQLVLLLTSFSHCHESTQYLQSAVRSLRNLRNIQTLRRADVAAVKASAQTTNRRNQYGDEVPPLTLTKGELTSLYETAMANGHSVKLDTGENGYIHAAVHHLDEAGHETQHVPYGTDDHDDSAGYYYYYYPIKSFLDKFTSSYNNDAKQNHYYKPTKPDQKEHALPYQYHSHTHQHNIAIKTETEKPVKKMEPLFMAISGFIGMAVMLVITMVVFPKLGINPKIVNSTKKKEKLEDFARLALDAIEGHCAERFACELTKTARTFHVDENRFYKLLRRMAPGTFGRYLNNAAKYSSKHLQCTAIPCTKKKPNPNNNKKNVNQKKKGNNNNNKQTRL
ncbi:uncharacterized protein LOC132708636 isoform X1 [Cylas formicarius]|uniref:uncharacterized protein LOC132708636 isoform X1 n=1 Tax=Cylas formicarius TaxID=197179 RepID=UPI0029584268|nr:uncharacterized protein LOC132708636 isoform X1 [Cylas formicarius]